MRVAVLILALSTATCGTGDGVDSSGTTDPESTPAPAVVTEPAANDHDRVLVKLAEGASVEGLTAGSLPGTVSDTRESIMGWWLLTFAPAEVPRTADDQAALIEALKALPEVADATPDNRQQPR
ncbi:MAG: hypothetical protein GY898_27975 [Proteobacteria bacterium]|nr:hypothetical protein [Pseudomonadota bacterium]